MVSAPVRHPTLPPARTERWRVPDGCPLTLRELRVLAARARGFTNKQTALALRCSSSTVRTDLHNAYRRLGVNGAAQAVIVCYQAGWLAAHNTSMTFAKSIGIIRWMKSSSGIGAPGTAATAAGDAAPNAAHRKEDTQGVRSAGRTGGRDRTARRVRAGAAGPLGTEARALQRPGLTINRSIRRSRLGV